VDQAHERVKTYLQAWTVLDLTGLVVLEAVRGVRDHQFNFWDAQIWAAARLNQIASFSARICMGVRSSKGSSL